MHRQIATEKHVYSEVLGLLCATLQVLLRKLQRNDVVQIADQVMQILLYMLTSADQSSVQEDTLLAIDALVNGMARGEFYFKNVVLSL